MPKLLNLTEEERNRLMDAFDGRTETHYHPSETRLLPQNEEMPNGEIRLADHSGALERDYPPGTSYPTEEQLFQPEQRLKESPIGEVFGLREYEEPSLTMGPIEGLKEFPASTATNTPLPQDQQNKQSFDLPPMVFPQTSRRRR